MILLMQKSQFVTITILLQGIIFNQLLKFSLYARKQGRTERKQGCDGLTFQEACLPSH